MKPFEIFRTGQHTSMQGSTLSFADADLTAIVAGYDTALHHAPIVVGHPKQDGPAYGWIDGLEIKGDRLVAKPANLDAAFSDLVREGKFKKVSAAFYQPTSANNPTPGSYYLRHVGFLGAAAPAVKGLKPIEFADDADTLVVEFADTDFSEWRQVWALEATARLFRGIRDWIIESKDVETADRIVSQWDVDQLVSTAAEIRADEQAQAKPYFSEPQREPTMKTAAELAIEQREARIAEREAAANSRDAAFAESQRTARATTDAAFVDGIVKAGKLPVGLQATATALFSDLGEDELTFAEGDETKKTTPRAAFRDLLEKLPIPVVAGELAKGDGPDFSDPVQVTAAIETEIKAAETAGETISPSDAWGRIQKRSK